MKTIIIFLFCFLLSFSLVAQTSENTKTSFGIVKKFNTPGPAPHGLAWDGKNLWLSDTIEGKIFQLTTEGKEISSFSWLQGQYQGPQGLTWDGNHLRNVSAGAMVFTLTTDGQLVYEFRAEKWSTGITWDGENLWVSDIGDFWGDGRIFQFTGDGKLLSEFKLPSFIKIPRGLAYDGKNLWLAEQYTRTIYKMDKEGKILESYLLYHST